MEMDQYRQMSLEQKRSLIRHKAAKIRNVVRGRLEAIYDPEDGTFDGCMIHPKSAIPELIHAGVAWAETGIG